MILRGLDFGADVFSRVREGGPLLHIDHVDLAGGAIALLGEQQFGHAAQFSSFCLYTSSRKMNATRSASCSIEPDSRRVAELRAMVALAHFRSAAQLRERENRHVKFFRKQLQSARELADFLNAIFVAPTPAHQLQIIDYDQAQSALFGLEAAHLRVQIHQVEPSRVVNEQGRGGKLVHSVGEFVALAFVQESCSEFLAIHARRAAQHTGEQRFLRHFQRKYRYRPFRLPQATCCAMFRAMAVLPMAGRAARMNSSPGLRPPVISSNFTKPGSEAFVPLAGIRKAFAPPYTRPGSARAKQAGIGVAVVDSQQSFFRASQDLLRRVLGHDAAVDQFLRGEDDLRSIALSRTMRT